MNLPPGDDQNSLRTDLDAIDAFWYEKLKAIEGGESQITMYTGSKERSMNERKKFLGGEVSNPTFDYPNIQIEALDQAENQLLQLKNELLSNEQNEVIQKVYLWKINERIGSVRMIKVTKEIELLVAQDSNPDDPVLQNKLRRFQRYTEYLHGKPSVDVFAYSVNSLRGPVIESQDTIDPLYKTVAQEFLDLVPEWKQSYQQPEQLTDEILDHARGVTRSQVGHIINIDNPKDVYDPEDIKSIFENSLHKMGAVGWTVVLHPVQRFMSINQTKKEVRIPAHTSQGYTHERLQALIAHELGTHVQRRLNGERSKLALLSTGLDRYSAGEEGVATVREQSISGDFSTDRWLERHLAIGMTVGLDGVKRDFREIFEIMWRYYYLDLRRNGRDHTEALSIARNKSYDRCVRTFRGTGGGSKGYCYTKDIDYAEGNIGVWSLIGKKPDEMMKFSLGKYDPTNERHLWVLSQLGITDDDLAELDQGVDGVEKSE